MCLHPQKVKNPNYRRSSYSLVGDDISINPLEINSNQEFIVVPCGTCEECRNSYYNSIIQRGIVESLSSYLYFVTLTYDDKHIPSLRLPNGKVVYYCDYKHIQDMFKRFRANNILDREFRYLCVNEYGDKRHRPHFHLIIFVQKYVDDDISLPYVIERILFDNLQKYYAVNVGTRKNPLYEKLFTYRIKCTPQGIKTNYFVKYVNPQDDNISVNIDTFINVKTLRYLLGYVSKGSKYDNQVKRYLDDINDELLKSKLRSILTSRVRYSKGFGLGFCENGKNTTTRYCVKASYFTSLYSRLVHDLDINNILIDDPNVEYDMKEVLLKLQTYDYKNFQEFRNCLEHESHLYAFVYICILFPRYISKLYKNICELPINRTISYLFRFLHPRKFLIESIATESNQDSYVRYYIRKGVDFAILNKVPFIAFPLYSSQSYMPLCKFYRERFCSHQDTLRMYESIGVSNFDEWTKLFTHYVNTKKQSLFRGNELKYESDVLQHVKTPSVKTSLLDIYQKV